MPRSFVSAFLIVVLIGVSFLSIGAEGFFSSPHFDYDQAWKQVKLLENKNLAKSALEEVMQIYQASQAEHNDPQTIKALIYISKYKQTLEEGGDEKILQAFEDEVKRSSFPEKNVLQSCAAELFWEYYQQNRWKFSQRTPSTYQAEDISTWDLQQIIQEASQLYKSSIEQKDSLRKIPLADFNMLLEKGNLPPVVRPSLYDFLAWRCIDFFTGEEAYITQSADQFTVDDVSAFAAAETFSKVNLQVSDTSGNKCVALKLLQQIISEHLNDPSPEGLIDADLQRLKFVHENTFPETGDSLYLQALQQLAVKYPDNEYAANATFRRAQFYYERGNSYNIPNDTSHRWNKKTALQICDQIVDQFPKSNAGKNALALKAAILQKDFTLVTENANTPKKPFLGLLTYQNLNTVYFRVIRNPNAEGKGNISQQDIFKKYLQQPVIASWTQSIPDPGDFQRHKVQIRIPALSVGSYLIIGSAGEDFNLNQNGLFASAVSISNIAYASKQTGSTAVLYVMNRESGTPISASQIIVQQQEYDYQNRSYLWKETGIYSTDQNGMANIPLVMNAGTSRATIVHEKDTLQSENFYPLNMSPPIAQTSTRTIFFLDRGIYRPGQTIYFKGIILAGNGDSSWLLTKYSTAVHFNDVNGREISSIRLITNDYGSFQGSFTAPSNGLLGNLSVGNETGSVDFSVEKYKRPQFEVNFDTVQSSGRLNDQVVVRGFANSYAGANISGATVTYRIVRQSRFPVWNEFRRTILPMQQPAEISHGMTATNDSGVFEISFKAIPDRSIPASQQPFFTYSIYADVKDPSGETQSRSTSVNVGYLALNADVNIPDEIIDDSLNNFRVLTKNLDGNFEAAQGTIEIFSLQAPDRILRSRLWDQPDEFVIPHDEFLKEFPNDIYDREDDETTWQRGKEIFNQSFDTRSSSNLSLQEISKYPQGRYVLVLKTKDKYDAPVETDQFFTLRESNLKTLPTPQSFWSSPLPASFHKGELLNWKLGTSEKSLVVWYEIQQDDSMVARKSVVIENGVLTIPLNISGDIKKGLTVSAIAVIHGRFHTVSQTSLPDLADEKLNLQFETFRDKLQPGSQEQWKIKISDAKNQPAAAEIVAAMYDASLDVFRQNNWSFSLNHSFPHVYSWVGGNFGIGNSQLFAPNWISAFNGFVPEYDQLNWFGLSISNNAPGPIMYKSAAGQVSLAENNTVAQEDSSRENSGRQNNNESVAAKQNFSVRRNLQETAFFFPQLNTDENGTIILSFSMPEALTRWKFLSFAHTRLLQYGFLDTTVVTQKDLMIQPNAPRFVREGDTLNFSARISNLTNHALDGSAMLEIFDARNMKRVDSLFGNIQHEIPFSVLSKQSDAVQWKISVPGGMDAIVYRVSATSGNVSDGEEAALPVLPDRILVTETFPFFIHNNESKDIVISKLLQSGSSSTQKNYNLSLEVTSNPAWYAVQSLPYLMENDEESADQVFNRYYSNALAALIANSNPKLKSVFDQWKNSNALISNLDKDGDLKSVLLQETPWVMQAEDETERKKRITLLFDINAMNNEQQTALQKLLQMQTPNGGWSWFSGMPDDRFITQYIVASLGHLQHLGVNDSDELLKQALQKAVLYLDERMKNDYENILKSKFKAGNNYLSFPVIQYLYGRSFFKEIPVENSSQKAFNFFLSQAKQYWTNENVYAKGMIALTLNRFGDATTSASIIRSLKENAIDDPERGMYWKENTAGYFWYQAPIETQSLLIEGFDEISHDSKSIDEMRLWLLQQKRTNDWGTTKATAEAIYALLLRGNDWLMNEPAINVKLGNTTIDLSKQNAEAGTGYFNRSWNASQMVPSMGNISISSAGTSANQISWGSVYYQYFENINKINPAITPLQVTKKLFIGRNGVHGKQLIPVDSNQKIQTGDLITVQLILKTDRDMEYIHLKDLRAAGFEPTDALSEYHFQDGLGYYEETRDASTNFFFDELPKGSYVLEYQLRATISGVFSNGIATIQCYYAPEFSAHSEGVVVPIDKK